MCANKNKLSVIRILQEDVLFDKYDWLTELNENISKITNSNKVYNIFMCKNNEYDIYKYIILLSIYAFLIKIFKMV